MRKLVCTMAVFAVWPRDSGRSCRCRSQWPHPLPRTAEPAQHGVPPSPAIQTHEYDREVVIRSTRASAPSRFPLKSGTRAYWGEKYGESFSLGAKCKEGPLSLEGPSKIKASVNAQPKEQALGGTERGGVTGKATLRGYTGEVESNGTFNGKRFEITFHSNRFRNRRIWRCAEVHEPVLKPTTFHLDNWWSKPKS